MLRVPSDAEGQAPAAGQALVERRSPALRAHLHGVPQRRLHGGGPYRIEGAEFHQLLGARRRAQTLRPLPRRRGSDSEAQAPGNPPANQPRIRPGSMERRWRPAIRTRRTASIATASMRSGRPTIRFRGSTGCMWRKHAGSVTPTRSAWPGTDCRPRRLPSTAKACIGMPFRRAAAGTPPRALRATIATTPQAPKRFPRPPSAAIAMRPRRTGSAQLAPADALREGRRMHRVPWRPQSAAGLRAVADGAGPGLRPVPPTRIGRGRAGRRNGASDLGSQRLAGTVGPHPGAGCGRRNRHIPSRGRTEGGAGSSGTGPRRGTFLPPVGGGTTGGPWRRNCGQDVSRGGARAPKEVTAILRQGICIL